MMSRRTGLVTGLAVGAACLALTGCNRHNTRADRTGYDDNRYGDSSHYGSDWYDESTSNSRGPVRRDTWYDDSVSEPASPGYESYRTSVRRY